MFHALLLAAVVSPCNSDMNQMDLTTCWTNAANAAFDETQAAYKAALAEMKRLGMPADRLTLSQSDWSDMRSKTCAFDASLYAGGSIAPMEEAMCDYRTATARGAQLKALTSTLKSKGDVPALAPVSHTAEAELDRLVRLYLKQDLTASQRQALIEAQDSWTSYSDVACQAEGGNCLTALTQERTAELKAGWVGEVFW